MAGRRRGWYAPEYKERIVELVRAGRSPGSSRTRVRAFAANTIPGTGFKQADLAEGRRSDGLGRSLPLSTVGKARKRNHCQTPSTPKINRP